VSDDLLFIDLEATGPDPAADRITEVAVVAADGRTAFASLVNPGRPIPPDVQRLTGITDELVADAPPFAAIAAELVRALGSRPLCGFGVAEFDLPLLAEECERAGVPYAFGPALDVGHLYKALRPRSLAAAVAEFCGREHAGAHRAEADARATAEVLAGMRLYEPRVREATPPGLYELARGGRPERADPAGKLVIIGGRVCFNDRRHRGVPVAEDLGYALWMLDRDFPLATLRVLRAEVDRIEREADARLAAEPADGTPVPAAGVADIPF
jgi:DNA polymerase III subunit epsilon